MDNPLAIGQWVMVSRIAVRHEYAAGDKVGFRSVDGLARRYDRPEDLLGDRLQCDLLWHKTLMEILTLAPLY